MKKRLIAFLFLPFLLAGCSSTYVYNNLDWLLYWYLDDYVELDKVQKKDFDIKLEGWLSWHRKEELLEYKSQLLDLKKRLNSGPLNADEWQQEFSKGRSHWERLRNRVGPELVSFAPRLTDKQVEQLFEELEKQNLENEGERAESTEAERRKERLEDIQDQLKGYIGKLTKPQVQLIEDYEDKFKTNFDNWISYRRNIQQAAKTLMESRNENPEFMTQLTHLMEHPENFQSEEYKLVSKHNRLTSAQMVADLNLTFTPKQMRKLNNKVDDLLEDLDDLIND